jgi:hypothetical protein
VRSRGSSGGEGHDRRELVNYGGRGELGWRRETGVTYAGKRGAGVLQLQRRNLRSFPATRCPPGCAGWRRCPPGGARWRSH